MIERTVVPTRHVRMQFWVNTETDEMFRTEEEALASVGIESESSECHCGKCYKCVPSTEWNGRF